ncbi:MAG: hypothetical protein Q8R32_00065, partial [bacterium]|nr:hypothetical protein [bacterium]
MTEARMSDTLPRWLRNAIVAAAALLVLFLVGRTARVPYRTTTQDTYTSHVPEIHGAREVGQTFESLRPFLSGVAFQVATYSDRKATGEAIFELRRGPGDSAILRAVRVPTSLFKDHVWHTFAFEPIPDSSGQTYYASLRSPSSRSGDAITLDFSAENPYIKGGSSSGLFIFRDEQRTKETVRGAEMRGADLAFAVFHRISLWERARLATFDIADVLRRETRRVTVLSLAGIAAVVLAVTALGPSALFGPLTRRSVRLYALTTLLLFLGLFFRLQYAQRLPVTNDEGSMLYDAWAFSQGRLPGGDGVLKTPTIVQALAAILRFLPEPTLLMSRLMSVVAGLLTLAPLLVLGRSVRGERGHSLRVAGLWL